MKRKLTLLSILSIIILSTNAQNSLQWEELGPKNVGGRTRAILLDHRDASRSTVYAGMVSGGLWKSTDHGATWQQLLSVYTCAAVTCIAQDGNGRIYFGTGEGLAMPEGTSRGSGSVGNGLHFLYGNDQDSILPSTMPTYLSNSVTWSMINRIAINPINPLDIYAAISDFGGTGGLEHSLDGGNTWIVIGSATAPISGLTNNYNGAADVKFSADGNYIFASVGLEYNFFPSNNLIISHDGRHTFSYVNDTSFPVNIWRIEIGTAPSDPLTAYISMAGSVGAFAGVWRTSDGGTTWMKIGSPTGVLTDVFGNDGQGWFDNAIAISPSNSGMIYLGGIELYSYTDLAGWTLASTYNGNINYHLPNWIHEDIQTIVFNDQDSDEMYIGCDGGIFKSINASSSFPNPTYIESNEGYNTVQNYSVAADLNGNVFGGTQDAGNFLVNINQGAEQLGTVDGVYTEISHFDSTVFIGGYIEGREYRSSTRGIAWISMFDSIIDPRHYDEPSICGEPQGAGNAPFITAFWLAETKNATNSVSNVPFVDNISHNAGDVVTVTSYIGQAFQDTLTAPLPAGDTVYVTDRLQSRLYFATSCGLWMTPDILNFGRTPRWFRITSSADDVKSFAFSATGDTIYLGRNSIVTRISGLNSVPFDSFPVGQNNIVMTGYPQYQEVNISVTTPGRFIEGLDVDVHDPGHVLCAVAGFTAPGTPHVYVSMDADSTWTAVDGNLPNMPVYQCVIDAYNSNHYIIGSEMGFWDSYDGGTTWTEQNGGIVVREPIYRLRQQTYLSDQCYALYAGTHGRGMWRCTTITAEQATCTVVPLGISSPTEMAYNNAMLLYPNPMDDKGKVMIELAEPSDVTLRVVDMTGRILQETLHSHLSEGANTLDLNTSSLSDGSYLVVARLSKGQTYTRTLVVAR